MHQVLLSFQMTASTGRIEVLNAVARFVIKDQRKQDLMEFVKVCSEFKRKKKNDKVKTWPWWTLRDCLRKQNNVCGVGDEHRERKVGLHSFSLPALQMISPDLLLFILFFMLFILFSLFIVSITL